MSCDWGYYCTQCEVESETWFNHGENLLREIYAAWPHVRAIQEINGDIEISIWRYQPWGFLAEHDGHPLMLASEYGDQEPLNPDDVTRSFTMRFEVTGAERRRVQEIHNLKHLPDGADVRRLYEQPLREALHNLIQPDS